MKLKADETPADVLYELAQSVLTQSDFVRLFFGGHVIDATSLFRPAQGVFEGETRQGGRAFRFREDALIGVLEGTGGYDDNPPA